MTYFNGMDVTKAEVLFFDRVEFWSGSMIGPALVRQTFVSYKLNSKVQKLKNIFIYYKLIYNDVSERYNNVQIGILKFNIFIHF